MNNQTQILQPVHTGWTTDNELKYLQSLYDGTYPRVSRIPTDPVRLLTNYVKYAILRTKWNTWEEVDGRIVEARARELLEMAKS